MKRVYFDSIGAIVPSPPPDNKTPCVAPRCADPLPPADRKQDPEAYPERFAFTDASTPQAYARGADWSLANNRGAAAASARIVLRRVAAAPRLRRG